jgi:hypothetical protein
MVAFIDAHREEYGVELIQRSVRLGFRVMRRYRLRSAECTAKNSESMVPARSGYSRSAKAFPSLVAQSND